ncbi:Uncharacterised protein [Chromobacterium violaceum]|uniref:Uncharacterized protein n=1 Tax=Chromobacterium violaceum TaxID=536 RepID=A0A447TCU0_CHRVL|nr:Uncharacterised protein [Chromobacterium violaceum]
MTHGVFNLFEAYPQQVGERHMNYKMRLTAEDGVEYFFSAFKSVPSDHGPLQAWADTSTLYVTVYRAWTTAARWSAAACCTSSRPTSRGR